MARPAQKLEATDVRAATLRAATHLFATHGADATSLQDIADEVGVRKPSLLYHFASKDELRGAVLDNLLSHWAQVMPELLASAVSGKRRFDTVMQAAIAFFSADSNRARLLLREMLDRPEVMRGLFAKHLAPWLTLVADYIRRGQSEGAIHADVDAEAYAFQVIHLVLSGFSVQNIAPSLLGKKAVERHLQELVRLAKAGLFIPKRK